jgi:hypothetical protein
MIVKETCYAVPVLQRFSSLSSFHHQQQRGPTSLNDGNFVPVVAPIVPIFPNLQLANSSTSTITFITNPHVSFLLVTPIHPNAGATRFCRWCCTLLRCRLCKPTEAFVTRRLADTPS